MASQRKTILVIHSAAQDPAELRQLLATMGHTAVAVGNTQVALKVLGTVRFDIIFAARCAGDTAAALCFLGQVRAAAPGSAVVAMDTEGEADRVWHAACDAIVAMPLSSARVQWVLDFELRYFGN